MTTPNTPLNWESVEGSGIPLTIAALISKLSAIQTEHGDLPCQFRNYLEENTLAPVTTLMIDRGAVVFECEDLPRGELPQPEDSNA